MLVDKLRTSDTENPIEQIPKRCSCSERFDAWGNCIRPESESPFLPCS